MAAFTVVRFVAQALNEEPRQFEHEWQAERAAREGARRQGAAEYYRVVGEPRTDIWRSPELLGGFVWSDDRAGRDGRLVDDAAHRQGFDTPG